MAGIKSVFGGATVNTGRAYTTVEALKEVFEILKANGVDTIDTAQIYGTSQELLGKAKAADSFTIDTKAAGGFREGSGTKQGIIDSAKESLHLLETKKVDIYYLHAPDSSIPISETLAGINEVYKSGGFSRFGLSNYKVEDVQKVYDHCKEHDYVLPSVYQGNYSPVARKQEELLFPTLRKLGMSFYAYSPLAGGFLTKTKEQLVQGAGRFKDSDPVGRLYIGMYNKPAYLEALAQWDSIAKEAGCTKADLAYRWVKFHSALGDEHGDAIIIGSSSVRQLEQTLQGINAGSLSADAVKKIDEVWRKIEHEAPLDNYNG